MAEENEKKKEGENPVASPPAVDDDKIAKMMEKLKLMAEREKGAAPRRTVSKPSSVPPVEIKPTMETIEQEPKTATSDSVEKPAEESEQQKMDRVLKNLEMMKAREKGTAVPEESVKIPEEKSDKEQAGGTAIVGENATSTAEPLIPQEVTEPSPAEPLTPTVEPKEPPQEPAQIKKDDQQKKFRLYPLYISRKMRVPADENELANLRDFVSKHGFRMGMDRKQVARCKLCVDEAFTNVFRHAYKEPFRIEEIDPSGVKNDLLDNGQPRIAGLKLTGVGLTIKRENLESQDQELPLEELDLSELIIRKCGGLEALTSISKETLLFAFNEALNLPEVTSALSEDQIPLYDKDMQSLIRSNQERISKGSRASMAKIGCSNRAILQYYFPNILKRSRRISGAIEHSARIEMYNAAKYVEIRVVDWGQNFSIDTEKISKPDYKHYIEIEKKGGLGLYMQRIGTDFFDMRRVANRNELIIRYNVTHPSFLTLIRKNIRLKEVSLPLRLGFSMTAAILLLLGGFYWFSMTHQARSLEKQFTDNAANIIKQLAADVTPILIRGERQPHVYMDLPHSVNVLKSKENHILSVIIVDRFGKVVGPDEGFPFLSNFEFTPPEGEVIDRKDGVVMVHPKTSGIYDLRFAVFPNGEAASTGTSLSIGTIHMTISESDMRKKLLQYQDVISLRMTLGAGALLGIMMLITLVLVMLRPLRELQLQIQRLSRTQDSEARLEMLEGPSDIQDLLDSLNSYAEKMSRRTRTLKRDAYSFSDQLEVTAKQLAKTQAEAQLAKSQAELEMEKKRSLQKEMDAAREIQEVLLPTELPHIPGYQIDAKYLAMTDMGGDYFDFFQMPANPDYFHVTVGDVAGHGLPSAMLMLYTKSQLKIHSKEFYRAGDVLRRVNNGIKGDFPPNIYITMFYAVLNAKTRNLNYSCAGHNPMIIYRGDTDQIFSLRPKGFAIGFDLPSIGPGPDAGAKKKKRKKGSGKDDVFSKGLQEESIQLRKGDFVFQYTDGITEAMNQQREEFGEIRLMKAIKKWSHLSAKEFSWKLIRYIRHFTSGVPQSDDICFIVLKEEASMSDLAYEKRVRLFDLIEKEGKSIAEACSITGIPKSEFEELKKIRDKKGNKGLRQTQEKVKKINIDHLDVIQSAKLLDIITKHPDYTIDQMRQALNTKEYGFFKVESRIIFRELKKLNITNLQKRISFAKRQEKRKLNPKADLFLRSSFDKIDEIFNTDDIPDFEIDDVIQINDLVIDKKYLQNNIETTEAPETIEVPVAPQAPVVEIKANMEGAAEKNQEVPKLTQTEPAQIASEVIDSPTQNENKEKSQPLEEADSPQTQPAPLNVEQSSPPQVESPIIPTMTEDVPKQPEPAMVTGLGNDNKAEVEDSQPDPFADEADKILASLGKPKKPKKGK